MPVTSKLYLSDREKWARDAVLQLMIDYAEAQKAGPLGHAEHEEKLDQGLDRAIQFLVTAARLPLEERLTAQQQQIDELKTAVEALKPAA